MPNYPTPSCLRFAKGFIQGSLLGSLILVISLIGWLIAILSGIEKPASFNGVSLLPLYILSFGLGGGVLYFLRRERARWYEMAFSYVLALMIVLLGCYILACLLESKSPIELYWGIGSFTVLSLLFGGSIRVVKKGAKSALTPDCCSATGFAHSIFTGEPTNKLISNAMTNLTVHKVIIAFLVLALFTSLGFLAHAKLLNYWWKSEVYGLAGYMGSTRAMNDYQHGKLRLFVIAGEHDKEVFSGTNSGPFEIWFPQYYTNYPILYPIRYSIEQRTEFYNRKMRYMHEHPEKFLNATNATTQ